MLLIQDVLGQRSRPWYLSHIWLHTRLQGILAKGNEKTDTIVMTTSTDLLEQVRMLYQQFHLSVQNLHKRLPELPVSQCKHLSGSV